MLWKFFGKGTPRAQGKIFSLFSWFSTQVIKKSMYSYAETFNGLLRSCPSVQRYSYFAPADIVGQDSDVQNSDRIPLMTLISLKNSMVLTASHSFKSSPEGSSTASYMFPLPSVLLAICLSPYPRAPFWIFFFYLKDLVLSKPASMSFGYYIIQINYYFKYRFLSG